jgi:protein-S-isoprenylcysteine O-methyltransferase Ste14
MRLGWLFWLALSLTDAVLLRLFPQPVVARLFDRSGWSEKQYIFTGLGRLFALACLALLTFTPLRLGSAVFASGLLMAVLALAGLIKALFDFRNTPPDQPVTRGMYAISRHPQIVMSSLVLLGGCFAIGSWIAMLVWTVARVLSHLGILAEEEVCLRQYGDSYRAYLQRVPRYFVFF